MKRYDMRIPADEGDGYKVAPIEEPNGEWVRYDEIEAELASLRVNLGYSVPTERLADSEARVEALEKALREIIECSGTSTKQYHIANNALEAK